MIKPSELLNIWSAPDNSRLTAKQASFRLPVHVAAKVAALCEMYPNKTRTEIVGDLLSSALEGVKEGFPFVKGKYIGTDQDTNEEIYDDAGPATRFFALTDKYYIELEKELGNENPKPLFGYSSS